MYKRFNEIFLAHNNTIITMMPLPSRWLFALFHLFSYAASSATYNFLKMATICGIATEAAFTHSTFQLVYFWLVAFDYFPQCDQTNAVFRKIFYIFCYIFS